jgi:ribonuclease Z
MFELIFLGTSASAPSIRRGLSAQIVMHREYRFLIDCGEGTQRQILRSRLGFKRLERILLTHGHLDHILGLGGLISTFSRWEAMDRIEIYGGAWALERVHDLIFGVVFPGAHTPMRIELVEIKPGLLLEDDEFELTAFPVSHRGPGCFGFGFHEKERRPFLNEVAEDLGVPRGPERRDLVNGRSVTLPDGRVIEPEQVLGPPRAGAKLVHVGDAGRTDNLLEHVRDADVLVIESTYLSFEADLALQFGHLTASQAAQLACDANVRQLYLTHISRRYREQDVLAEAVEIFPHTTVARDFDHVRVAREKIEKEEGGMEELCP